MVEVTKDQFEAYERVRQAGFHNMLTDGHRAADDAKLDWKTYQSIVTNYDAFDQLWPDVRELLVTQVLTDHVALQVPASEAWCP